MSSVTGTKPFSFSGTTAGVRLGRARCAVTVMLNRSSAVLDAEEQRPMSGQMSLHDRFLNLLLHGR